MVQPCEPHRADLARTFRLAKAFRLERSHPRRFYGLLACDTVAQLASYADLSGATVLDVGAGPGFFIRELKRAGARCVGVDLDIDEITAHGRPPAGYVVGDALRLPFDTGVFDVCLSSNVLEHVSAPWRMADEMVRVTRPGGLIYLAFTNWLSPWGGHETSPWHYLGGERAARWYERRHGHPPKNRYGRTLHKVSVADALAWARRNPKVQVLDAMPRYAPSWAKGIVQIPIVREILTWNLALVLRKAA